MAKRSVVVTGGSSGIGREIAFRFAELGDRVFVASLGKRPMDGSAPTHEIINSRGGTARFRQVDVRSESEVTRLFSEAEQAHGPVEILVNSAGVTADPNVGSLDMEFQEWNRVIETNLTGTWLCCRAALRQMLPLGRGSIINIGSRLGMTAGPPGRAAYCASKAGISNLTRQLAAEFGPRGIQTNCVCPGFVPHAGNAAMQTPEILEQKLNETPSPRLGTVADIASATLFLCDPANSWINGHNLVVDGGALAKG